MTTKLLSNINIGLKHMHILHPIWVCISQHDSLGVFCDIVKMVPLIKYPLNRHDIPNVVIHSFHCFSAVYGCFYSFVDALLFIMYQLVYIIGILYKCCFILQADKM